MIPGKTARPDAFEFATQIRRIHQGGVRERFWRRLFFASEIFLRECEMNLSHRRCMNRHFTPDLRGGAQEPLALHLVEHMESPCPRSYQEEGFSKLACHFLEDAMARYHERLLIENAQAQRQQSHARSISTRFCLLHQTTASQSRKQAMDTRLRHIERPTNRRHTTPGG